VDRILNIDGKDMESDRDRRIQNEPLAVHLGPGWTEGWAIRRRNWFGIKAMNPALVL
jgi:hypothetical protein